MMNIIRNGFAYELTWQEMREAYLVVDREYLKEDIVSKAEDMGIDLSNKDLNNIAENVHKALGHNDSYWDSYWMSIEYVLKENEKEV